MTITLEFGGRKKFEVVGVAVDTDRYGHLEIEEDSRMMNEAGCYEGEEETWNETLCTWLLKHEVKVTEDEEQ